MLLRIFDDRAIGGGKGAGQHLRDRAVEIVIQAAHHVGGQRARHFAGGMAAHAVGDQGEAAAIVLVSSSCGRHHATEFSMLSVRTSPVSVRMAPMISMPAGALTMLDSVTRIFVFFADRHWQTANSSKRCFGYGYGEALRCGCKSSRT